MYFILYLFFILREISIYLEKNYTLFRKFTSGNIDVALCTYSPRLMTDMQNSTLNEFER